MLKIKLNNGIEMPQIGLGTFLIPKDNLSRTIAEAYELGYRQIDTAWRYHNEKEIAKALKENGIKREDVFITTKVNRDALYFRPYRTGRSKILNIRNFKSVKQVILESFDNLGTDYIDLFLVHWPYPMELSMRMYEELTKLYHEGRIRAIGVCSSLPPVFDAYLDVSDVVPAVNQFEISPLNTQKQLIKYSQDRGVAVEAMSTFSHFRSNEPRKEILENQVIYPIAEKYGKSIAQVVLRWMIQQSIIIIPKTWDSNYLKENISIEDFALTEEEMSIIDSLDEGRFLNYDPYRWLQTIPNQYRENWKGFTCK